MVERTVTKIEQKRKISLEEGRKQYKVYFRVSLYRKLYQEEVDETLRVDGYEDCIMTLEELTA